MLSLAPEQHAVSVFAGIGVTLLVASAIGYVLKAVVAHGEPHGVIDNLNARIRTWWLIVLAIAAACLLGRAGITLLFAFVSLAALREFTSTPCTKRDEPVLAVAFLGIVSTQYVLVHVAPYAFYALFVPVLALLFAPLTLARAGGCERIVERATNVQLGLLLCVFCISHIPALLTLDIAGYAGRNVLLVVFLIVVTQASDVLQYTWGKLLGRHKVAPTVSPSKTWEGLIGGVASATALGGALFWITPFNAWEAGLIAFAVNLLGFLGGLALSAIKRERGIKDWGRMIAGHGGMLDRIDSLVFAAPVFFHFVRQGWT